MIKIQTFNGLSSPYKHSAQTTIHVELKITMTYSIKKTEIIDYPPEQLNDFETLAYEWIDNLNFTINPKDCLENAEAYISIVKQKFLKGGWHGDGDIELMWIPPFMLNQEKAQWIYTKGITVWHVKQLEDGISWLLYPKELFENNKI